VDEDELIEVGEVLEALGEAITGVGGVLFVVDDRH
jgi:hypothetical protein